VVITFFDITEMKRVQALLREAEALRRLPWWCATRTMPSPCKTWRAGCWLESGREREYG